MKLAPAGARFPVIDPCAACQPHSHNAHQLRTRPSFTTRFLEDRCSRRRGGYSLQIRIAFSPRGGNKNERAKLG